MRLFRNRRYRPWGWCGLALFLAASPILGVNLAVSGFGSTLVFPLSVSALDQKAEALRIYFAHRKTCLFRGHPSMEPLIAEAEQRHRLPPGLLAALVEVESGTRPHRISRMGAMGPGQLTASTARELGVADPFDPETAVDASARYLASHLRRFRGALDLALAAYNAGPGAVRGSVPRNGETEFFVPKVLAEYARRRPAQASLDEPGP